MLGYQGVEQTQALSSHNGGSQIQNVSQSIAYSQKVKAFYQQHNPSKIEDGTMDRLLSQHRGKEDELLRKITEKYMGGGGGGKPKTRPKQKAVKPAWVDVVEEAPVAVPEADVWSRQFSPPNQASMKQRHGAPFSFHGAGPLTEAPLDEMEALHAKYDQKYGRPKQRR